MSDPFTSIFGKIKLLVAIRSQLITAFYLRMYSVKTIQVFMHFNANIFILFQIAESDIQYGNSFQLKDGSYQNDCPEVPPADYESCSSQQIDKAIICDVHFLPHSSSFFNSCYPVVEPLVRNLHNSDVVTCLHNKFSWPGDSEGAFRSSSQVAT